MINKTPHPVDTLVGSRVRALRTARGLSQTSLAHELGITFQQVQKYEKGANRISASKLFEISRVLNVGVADLYSDAEDDSGVAAASPAALDHAIIRALARIDDDRIKRKVLALIHTLAPETADNDL